MANRRVRTTRTASKGAGVDMLLSNFARVASSGTLTLTTTGDADSDLGSIDLTQGDTGSVTRAVPTHIYVEALTAAGTLAVGQLEVRTAAAGAGSAVVADAALTGLTAANLVIARTVVPLVVTTGRLYIRQKTDSGNAGTIRVHVLYMDVTS